MRIIKNFPVTTGKICFMSALTDILNFYKYDLSESDLFGLCEGKLLYFGGLKGRSQEELKNKNLLRELNMGGIKFEIMQMVNVLQNVLGLSVESYETLVESELKKIIKENIDRGIPLLALVLRYYLEYGMDYNRDKFSHTVTVYGYDFEQEQLHVTDTFVNTKPISNYKGTLAFSNFIKALDLSPAVFKMVAKERILAIKPEKKQAFQTIPIHTLNMSLVNMAKNNLEGKVIQEGIATGIYALDKFINEFGEWRKQYSMEFFQIILQALHSVITNYGGPYVTNELLSDYLKGIYLRNNRTIYRDMAEQSLELRRLWLVAGNMCFMASMGKTDGDICERLLQRFKTIYEKEESFYTGILEKQSGMGLI